MLILTFIRPGHEPSLNQVSLHMCVAGVAGVALISIFSLDFWKLW